MFSFRRSAVVPVTPKGLSLRESDLFILSSFSYLTKNKLTSIQNFLNKQFFFLIFAPKRKLEVFNEHLKVFETKNDLLETYKKS